MTCPLCDRTAEYEPSDTPGFTRIICTDGARYEIMSDLEVELRNADSEWYKNRALLLNAIKRHNGSGDRPVLTYDKARSLMNEQRIFSSYELLLAPITKALQGTVGKPHVDFGSVDYFVFSLIFEGTPRELKVYREFLDIAKTPEAVDSYMRKYEIANLLKTVNAEIVRPNRPA